MVSKNRIKVMLIYIFLAIYISIRTVNVYAASGNSPVKNTNVENWVGEGSSDSGSTSTTNGGTPTSGNSAGVTNGNLWVNVDDVKSHTSEQLGNCDGQDYAMGSITIPSLEINPIVVSNTKTWGQSEFETWLKE